MYAILEGHTVVPTEDVLTWAKWYEENRGGKLKDDRFDEGVRVSTVFLGLDHGFGDRHEWFETMIFGGKHDEYQCRYETWDDAVKGHLNAVNLVKSELGVSK